MSDKLKQHIEASRGDFEVFPYDVDNGWNEFVKDFVPVRKIRWRRYVISAVAACIIFMAGGVSFMIYNTYQTSASPMVLEWMETERFYQQEINELQKLVTSRVDDPLILEDLEEMDKVIKSLKSDLKDQVDNEEVIMAVMDQYRLKLRILERMLEKLEDKEKTQSIESTI